MKLILGDLDLHEGIWKVIIKIFVKNLIKSKDFAMHAYFYYQSVSKK